MPDTLIECPHCHGEKVCKADHGHSCEVCKTAAGKGRKATPTAVRCSYCSGHGRMWVGEKRLAEMQAEQEEAAAAAEAETTEEAPEPAEA
jgi:hypothetical protein